MRAPLLPSRASRDESPAGPTGTDLVEAELQAYALARGVALPAPRTTGFPPGDRPDDRADDQADDRPDDRADDRSDDRAQADWLAPLWSALHQAGVAQPGLAFAASAETTALGGVLAPILANSPDIAALLDSLGRFHPLIGRNELVVRRRAAGSGPATVSVSLRALDGGAAHPETVDACFAMLCRTVRRLAGEGVLPDRVLLRRPAPEWVQAYRSALGPVSFGQPSDACVFGPTALRAPVRLADPVVLAMLAPYAERRLALNHTRWSETVRAALQSGAWPAGPPRLADVARTMAVGRRTLQLRLQEEGCSFSALVEAVQRDRALALLAEPEPAGLSVGTIATRVGFATPAALTRAVRRWTGLTPSAYRRAAGERR